MSYVQVALGPVPCHTCGMSVAWIRTFDALILRGVWYDSIGRRQFSLHECAPTFGFAEDGRIDHINMQSPKVRRFIREQRAKLDEQLDADHQTS